MRVSSFDVSGPQPEFIEFRSPPGVEWKKGPAFKVAIAGSKHLGFFGRQQDDVPHPLVAQKVRIAHVQTARNLPQESYCGHAFTGFDLP
jgi:hypothetical protein